MGSFLSDTLFKSFSSKYVYFKIPTYQNLAAFVFVPSVFGEKFPTTAEF